jgi:L-rhamnose-H+ transport protein
MGLDSVVGMALLLAGAICGGCFGLPSKFAGKDTPWETLWGPFFLFVTVLIPVLIFPLIADGLFATCAQAGVAGVLAPVLFGFLWGLGSMSLGLSFAFIGLSLAYAINYGAQIAFGGMGPFLIHHSDQLFTLHGGVISAGVCVCLGGVVVCGRAAMLRESSQRANAPPAAGAAPGPGQPMLTGLIMALVSGILCACYGIAASFGGTVTEVSTTQFGNAGWRAAFVVCALILWGGSLSACGYCIFKLFRNRTWGTFVKPGIGRVLAVALVMALLHDGAILLFGVGASKLGALGFAVGYAVFMSFAIIVGNVNGFLTGEWKGASRRSVGWLAAGILVLVGGVSALATGNYLHGQAAERAKPAAREGPGPERTAVIVRGED